MASKRNQTERGAALVLALFALLLLSAIGFFMYLASGTEHNIDSNYGSGLGAYYAARSGLEEVRDRVKYPNAPNPAAGGLSDLLPTDVAGNKNGVLYILHPANGEVVDPTDITSKYFDDQLCHDYNSGAVPGVKCAIVPATAGWMATQPGMSPNSGSLTYKWVRVNMKTNRTMQPNYCVDSKPGAVCPAATADARVCWDGETEQLSPGGAAPACDANGMLSVYMLTSLAMSGNTRRLLRSEVVAPSIRPPGAITIEGAGSSSTFSGGIPAVNVDGREHDINGNVVVPDPSKPAKCSNIAAVATDTAQSTAQLETALNILRMNIVNTANSSCNADGSSMSGKACTPALWWVRGTDSATRFVTSTSGSGSSGSDGGSSGSDGGSGSLSLSGSTTCTSSTPNCFTSLNLGAPQLYAQSASTAPHIPNVVIPSGLPPSPFVGGAGNQPDSTIYQSGSAHIVQDTVAAVNAFVTASQGQPNYFSVSALNLPNPATFGSLTPASPAIVVFTDASVKLQTNLTGYGILVIPNNFEIATGVTFQWTGIVLVQANSSLTSNAQFIIDQGATGSVTGAVLLQAGSTVTLQSQASTSPQSLVPSFHIAYSCDAVDMPFNALPMKTISSADFSY